MNPFMNHVSVGFAILSLGGNINRPWIMTTSENDKCEEDVTVVGDNKLEDDLHDVNSYSDRAVDMCRRFE